MCNIIIDLLTIFIIFYLLYSVIFTDNIFINYIDRFQNEPSDNTVINNNPTQVNDSIQSNNTIVNPTINLENAPIVELTEKLDHKNPEIEKNIKSKNLNKNYTDYSNGILNSIIKNQSLLNDRYRLQRIFYKDNDLQNEILTNEYLNELENPTNDINNYNSLNVIITDDDIDSQLLNKSKKCQKLFKDSKTIAARFNKNSLYNEYSDELDFYEDLRTPWWSEDNMEDE